jgi:hypothetical protein
MCNKFKQKNNKNRLEILIPQPVLVWKNCNIEMFLIN